MQAECGRERDPDGRDQEQEHSDPVERGVDLLERPRDLQREPGVVDGERVDAQMRAGDARVGEERSMVAGSCRRARFADGQVDGRIGGADRLSSPR